jgi:hypothetical protein
VKATAREREPETRPPVYLVQIIDSATGRRRTYDWRGTRSEAHALAARLRDDGALVVVAQSALVQEVTT